MDALVAAHDAHREHPVRANEPGQALPIRRRGSRQLVTVKEHRGLLLGVCPGRLRGARRSKAPLWVSRDTSRFRNALERHVASVPRAADRSVSENSGFTGRDAQQRPSPINPTIAVRCGSPPGIIVAAGVALRGSGTIAHETRTAPPASQLDACLRHLRAGDTRVVWRHDRHGRGLGHLIALISSLSIADGIRSSTVDHDPFC